jgi:hypothetical protein
MVRRVEQVLLARGAARLVADRQLGDADDLLGLEVELDQAVEERDLQEDALLVGRDRDRADGASRSGWPASSSFWPMSQRLTTFIVAASTTWK